MIVRHSYICLIGGNRSTSKGQAFGMTRTETRGIAGKTRHETGFTLVEMSIVVMILGLILTIAGLNYANISRGVHLSGAKRQIEAALVRAKTAARQENVSYRMTVYPASDASNPNNYEFMRNVLVGQEWVMTPVNLSVSGERVQEESGRWLIGLEGNVEMLGGVTEITFSPAGTLMNVTPATIDLRSGNQTGSVSIDALGKVTVN
jgi:prepilin-type N-terminal cleavage/methylation domain-containing protein